MSDHVDFPGHDEQHASPPSEGDFPADFFDDAAAPEAAPVGAGDWPSIEAEPAPVEALEETEDAALPIESAVAPSAYSKGLPGPPEEPPPTAPVFPIVLGLVMIGMLVAAIFVSKLPPAAKPKPPPPPRPRPPPRKTNRPRRRPKDSRKRSAIESTPSPRSSRRSKGRLTACPSPRRLPT